MTETEQDDQEPDNPRSAKVVEDPAKVPEAIKPSATGTVAGSDGGDPDEDEEQSDPGGDSDTT